MILSASFILLVTFSFILIINAGFVPPAELCLPTAHLKKLEGCIAMTDKEDECAAKESDDEKLKCYCTQETLDSIFACKDDVRRCLETHMFDPQFDLRVSTWHSKCDSRLPPSASLTTPSITSLTTTYDFNACRRLEASCYSGNYESDKCWDTWMPTSSLSFASCVCQPPIYSLFSECQYNGNVSCKRTTAHKSNIMGYSICSYFWSGSETLSSVDLTSMLSKMGDATTTGRELARSTPASHVRAIAELIRSTQVGGEAPVQTGLDDQGSELRKRLY